MKIKEISLELNIPEGTIKYYIHLIKDFLKKENICEEQL